MPIPSTPSIMPNVLGYAADTVQIPETTPTGQGIPSFRDLFPFITQVDPDAGGVMVERSWMNALFNLLGQHAFFQQSGCVYPWQDTLNYITGSHVKGSDDVEYIALQPSGPDVSGVGAKDPAQQANRAYWVSLASFVSGDFVPDSRRVIAGTGLTGGGPLSADVTLAAKLTDSVSSTDSTIAASAAAVKLAYDRGSTGITAAETAQAAADNALNVANARLPLSGGAMTGRISGLRGTYNSNPSSRYSTSALEIRENDAVGIAQSDIAYAPAIGFHWLNQNSGILALQSNGVFSFLTQAGARASVECEAAYAVSAGVADMRVYATQTFSSITSFTLPPGGSWLVIATNAGVSGGFVGVYAGGATVTSEVQILANCIKITK